MAQRFLAWFALVALGILPFLVFSYLTVNGVRGWIDGESGGRIRFLSLLLGVLLSCAIICTAVILLRLAPAASVLLVVVDFVCGIAGTIISLALIVMWLLPRLQAAR